MLKTRMILLWSMCMCIPMGMTLGSDGNTGYTTTESPGQQIFPSNYLSENNFLFSNQKGEFYGTADEKPIWRQTAQQIADNILEQFKDQGEITINLYCEHGYNKNPLKSNEDPKSYFKLKDTGSLEMTEESQLRGQTFHTWASMSSGYKFLQGVRYVLEIKKGNKVWKIAHSQNSISLSGASYQDHFSEILMIRLFIFTLISGANQKSYNINKINFNGTSLTKTSEQQFKLKKLFKKGFTNLATNTWNTKYAYNEAIAEWQHRIQASASWKLRASYWDKKYGAVTDKIAYELCDITVNAQEDLSLDAHYAYLGPDATENDYNSIDGKKGGWTSYWKYGSEDSISDMSRQNAGPKKAEQPETLKVELLSEGQSIPSRSSPNTIYVPYKIAQLIRTKSFKKDDAIIELFAPFITASDGQQQLDSINDIYNLLVADGVDGITNKYLAKLASAILASNTLKETDWVELLKAGNQAIIDFLEGLTGQN